MSDPFNDEPSEGMLDGLLRRVPGYQGYLDRDARRKSDQLAREMIADQLERAKRALDGVTRMLLEQGAIDALPKFEQLRGRFDLAVAQLRGAPAGYQSFFELDDVTEELLEDVYEHDLWTIDEAQKLGDEAERLAQGDQPPGSVFSAVGAQLTQIEDKMRERGKLLAEMKKMY